MVNELFTKLKKKHKKASDIPSLKSLASENYKKHKFIDYFYKLFICFWVFSVIGHYVEILWGYACYFVFGGGYPRLPRLDSIAPLAQPYGFGAIAIIIFIVPLVKKFNLNFFFAFLLNTVAMTLVEYYTALFLIIVRGRNDFWDYSGLPYNLNGHIWLGGSIAFGIGATIFLYYIYPLFVSFIKHLKDKHIKVIFWTLFITYILDFIFFNFRNKL